MCTTCKGKGTVYRPYSRKVKEIVRQVEVIDGHEFKRTEAVEVESGGIDACPVCAAKAEAEWQSARELA